MGAALPVFLATYAVVAIGRLPGFRVDRTGAAIIGATLMIGFGVLSLDQAYRSIDYDTIILLFGMMIVVANLRLSGFFGWASASVVEHTRGPLAMLAAIILVAGVFSAFFVNDTMCLVLTPLVLDITERQHLDPVPYLLAVAMAANIGSVATLTGNPQNMMIGSFSDIGYREFAAALAPVAAAGLVVTFAIIAWIYRGRLHLGERQPVEHRPVRINRALLWKSVAVSAVMLVLFFAGLPPPKVALLAGAALLVTRRVKPEKVYREIDWPLLVLFIGLFIVVAGAETTPLAAQLLEQASRRGLQHPGVLSTVAALLSNLVSNVPAVLVLKPAILRLADPRRGWLLLAMASTLAGNLTVVGSVANLIVIERARSRVRIGFWEYFRVGAPLTAITIALGAALL